MPQDTAWLDNRGGYIIIPSNPDSIPADVKDILQQFSSDPRFKKKQDNYADWAPLFYTIGMLVLIWVIIRIRDGRSKTYVALGSMVNNETDYDIDEKGNLIEEKPDYLVYEGSELNLTNDEVTAILSKRSIYFTRLPKADKERFVYRLQKFMKLKTFFIHDKSGYKEMPVLISSAAIQVSFGLVNYLLPDFPCIHIFPEEFIATEPTIRFLEGNVSDNCINISWKHFLNGFNNPDDGQNVGLHEMAHAYYFQNVETPDNKDQNFVHTFSKFNNCGNTAFEEEQKPGNDLYSEYAMKNFQEFWAETVEIFFEKPVLLKTIYPALYAAVSDLLNQDPINV
ncbi:MAG: zinc-dependent peptidase [Ferruginibacter sp.]